MGTWKQSCTGRMTDYEDKVVLLGTERERGGGASSFGTSQVITQLRGQNRKNLIYI